MTETSEYAAYHRAEVNGIRMFYRRAGSGPPVVLLHGFPETSHCWRRIIPVLAEHHTVIAPDLRGCGASDRPEMGYDKRTVASDVRELVRQLGLGQVDLVAHDVGMMVGYAYACAYPDDVRRLVLMEAALPGLGLEALYDAAKYPRMYHLPLFEAPNALAEALIAGRERMFVEHFMRQQAYNQDGLEPEALDEYARCLAAPGALSGGIGYFRAHRIDAVHNRDYAETRLAMPVMTIGGAASFGADLKGQVEPLVEHLHHVMIEECGHYLAEEQPGRVADELLRFFAG
ncbi:alpha/beta fold hydrolase [Glacieibacterium megasporae]|uniref:alpha/beta fold hydrolase n=1 Tax=Glacieibacterium megasporae TaxID=2835787 RepID=UPI001C1E15FB|nr:alpha/beta hydrolase [Polymorphobacter megasporae]UAJ10564.1 alpha/beta hydrolase [Polymorphobacter megasporae]